MIYLRLFFEFFRTGLFAVGGGMATIPFLMDMGPRTAWFTQSDLANMIAVAESTPGPVGVNMATYVGFTVAGIPGAVISTIGLVCPSLIIVYIVAKMLNRFRNNIWVNALFKGLRPASIALIVSAGLNVACVALFSGPVGLDTISYPAVILAVVLFVCMHFTPMEKLHPVVFILVSAAVGILLKL